MNARRRDRGPAPWVAALAVLCLLLVPSVVSSFLPVSAVTAGSLPQPAVALGPGRDLAPGVTVYHVTDRSTLDPPAPVSIWILRVDTAAADLRAVLANDEVMETERVADMAARHGAVAAINAGFFLPNGDPAGIYKLGGRLVSDTRRPRGAVGLIRSPAGIRLIFGRVTAKMSLVVRKNARRDPRVEIAGVDTTRRVGQLMLFTPAYHAHTDTASGGLEWILDGRPLRVREPPRRQGKTPIPKEGFVLSFGGPRPPPALAALRPGARVDLETHYGAAGDPGAWAEATEIIGGAGLLARDGRIVDDWSAEVFNPGFAEMRHPRTAIGTKRDGTIWLITVDGRQPGLSAGMTLVELRGFARRLGLVNVLNLDGGGSTTMWAAGEVLNSPSDIAGARKVSDALLVVRR